MEKQQSNVSDWHIKVFEFGKSMIFRLTHELYSKKYKFVGTYQFYSLEFVLLTL